MDAQNSTPPTTIPEPEGKPLLLELSADVASLRKENIKLREKLLSLREKELFELKERLTELALHFKVVAGIATLVVAIAAVFGIKQYADLDKVIGSTIAEKIDKSLGYYDQFSRAATQSNNGLCGIAIPQFKELMSKRADDELVFLNLVNCLIEIEDFDEAYRVIAKAREQNFLPRRFVHVLTYNNSGFAVLVKSLRDSNLEREALELLTRAEQIGVAENSPDLPVVLHNLSYYFLAVGNLDRAKVYAQRFTELDAGESLWRTDAKRNWFKTLEKKHPSVRSELQKLYPALPRKQ